MINTALIKGTEVGVIIFEIMLYLNSKNRDFDEPKAEIQERLNYSK